jgi:hypothetical protein
MAAAEQTKTVPEDDAPLDAERDEELSRTSPWWDVGGLTLTVPFWVAIALVCFALFRSRSLPLVDYPQHLALAGILRRMLDPAAPERQLFETNLLSYNSAFHVLVAALNVVMPIDAAGKVVVSLYIVLASVATLLLLRATGRPRARAYLMVPVLVGYSFAWGFINFGLGVAIQLIVLARVLEVPPRHRLKYDAITALLATLGAWTHLLGSALGYMLMLVAIVVRMQTDREPFMTRFGRAIRTGAPLLPAIVYCVLVYYRQQRLAWQNFEYGAYEGNDVFAMAKIKGFLGYATGLRADELDVRILGVGLGLLFLAALLRDTEDETPRVLPWLFVASLVAYLVIPHVFWATNFVFERITFLVVLTAILWAPRARPKQEELLRLMGVSVGLGAAVSFYMFMGRVADETADLDAVIEAMPKNRRVTGLFWYPKIDVTFQWSLLHSPAYYVARNGGEVAFSFTRTMSLPVHYKRETLPPDPPANFEWNPSDYRANTPYAKYFDLILMKTTHDDGRDPRESVWHSHANEVDVVLHRGRYWVFETKRVTDDKPTDGFWKDFIDTDPRP